jgi:sigma-B regulation protein RsbU (phosphoserine phosphatase)
MAFQAEEERIQQEMAIARQVQDCLLPLATPELPGLSIATHTYPARTVGGDAYDLIELRDGRLLAAIADVSGKGIPAALLTGAVLQSFRQCAGPDPAVVLAGVNRALLENMPEGMFVTSACVVIDPRDGSAAAAAAGHPPPLWWRSAEQCLVPVTISGVPLGVLPDWSGLTRRWQLDPGDGLMLYTDGVLDAKTSADERLGEECLAELLNAAPADAQEWIGRLRRALENCIEWPDDITAVACVRSPQ